MRLIPTHLDEADVLDYAEGQPVAAGARAAIEAALAEDRVFARMVRGMQADRSAMATLPRVSAPADLFDRVERQLASEALAAVSAAANGLDSDVPVSKVQPPRRRLLVEVLARPWAKPLAAAAAFAVLATGAWVLLASSSDSPRTRNLAINSNPSPAQPIDQPRSRPANGTAMADNLNIGPAAAEIAAVLPGITDRPTEIAIAATTVAETEPTLGGMTLANALQLASEGRLALHVLTPDAPAAVTRVAQLVGRDRGPVRVRQATEAEQPALVALADGWHTAAPGASSSPKVVLNTERAAEDPAAVGPVRPGVATPSPVSWSAIQRVQGTFRAEMPVSEAALRALVQAVGNGQAQKIVFLREMPVTPPTLAVRSAESILWWRSMTSAAPRALVPVIVEQR